MTTRFRVGDRIAAIASPLSARHIPPGTTGLITDLIGWRAFEIIFDGDPRPIQCQPEYLRKLAADAASLPALSPFKFKARGAKTSIKSI
jgi:hypothetical protein